MYVETVPNRNSPPAILVRESYREDGKVKKRTVANISHLPPHAIEAVRRSLKEGPAAFAGRDGLQILRSLPHGHVAAVLGTLKKIGLDREIASRRSPRRDLAVALIASRLVAPASKLATSRDLSTMANSTLAAELGLESATEYDLYDAMDWLLARQDAIERKLAAKHLSDGALVLYDVSSSYYTGSKCELAKRGYPRDGKRGVPQINYGLLCNQDGCPVSVEVFEGNTADPSTLGAQVTRVREKFGVSRVVFVADRGTITSARIKEELEPVGLDWITALRAPAIKQLAKQGTIQPSLFDEVDLAEITSEDYPNERLIVCRNPLLAAERERKREALLADTEAELEKIRQATLRKRNSLRGAGKIGVRVGRVINKRKVAKHFILTIGDDSFEYERDLEKISSEAALDGIYVIRTSVDSAELDGPTAVARYKDLQHVEQAFRCLKSVDLKVRPIHHRKADRVRSHIFLCLLAYHVQWHMQRLLAPILFYEDDPEGARGKRKSVVAPAQRSDSAKAKEASKQTPDGECVASFTSLMRHLATLTRNSVQAPGSNDTFTLMTEPTALQSRAFELLKVRL